MRLEGGLEIRHEPTEAADERGSLGFEHYATQTAWRKVVARVKP